MAIQIQSNRDHEVSGSNIVLLIDQFTKNTVDSITYDALNKHVTIITDMKELAEVHRGASVVMFEPAVSLIVTPEILQEAQESLGLKFFLFYQSDAAIAAVADKCQCIKADYSVIDWNIVYAAVRQDLAILEPYQRSVRVLDAYKGIRDRLPADLQEYFTRFHTSYMDLAGIVNTLLSENAGLRETVATQEKLGELAVSGISELKDLLDYSQDRCNAYETLLSKSYDITKGGFFPDKPRVMYIKSISHVAGMDTLISALFAALKTQYKVSVKVVKLVDAGTAQHLHYIPNYYVHVQDSYNTAVLLESEHLLKLGAYSIMFDTLLLNRSGLEYLIVHDMRSTPSCALDSTLIDLRLNELTADYVMLGEYDNVISDSSKGAMFQWSWKEIQKHTGTKSVRLVSHPTVVSILEQFV